MSNNIRIPPQHLESEKALIGSILLNPDAFYEVSDILKKEVFYSPKHQKIFTVMKELVHNNDPIDMISVSKKLEEGNQLEEIGGREYLLSLSETIPSSYNAPYYAKTIKEKYTRRSLISAGEVISALGYDESNSNIQEVVDNAEKALFDITFHSSGKQIKTLSEELPNVIEHFQKLGGEDHIRGIPTGFTSMDNKLAGMQNSDLLILAARPSVGKTTLALDIARKTAIEHKNPVAIFSLEMSSHQLIERMLAAEAYVDSWKLRIGRLLKDEGSMERINDALGRLSNAPIYVDDRPANSILSIKSTARRLKREKDIKLIIVDYLQLIVPYKNVNSESMVQQITEISRSLKQIARELEIPVLALSQLSRDVEKRQGKPRLSDLRDSGSIEQDADVVMFLHRDQSSNVVGSDKREIDLLIEKHRNGPTGQLRLAFQKHQMTFTEIDTHNAYQKEEVEGPKTN